MCGSCFLIHSANLRLLIEAFNPFTFKVIIGRYLFIADSLYLCSSLFLSFPSFPYSSPFSISCRAGLVEVFSFRLLLSGKLLIWPSILIERLAGYSSLGCRPLVLIPWNIFCQSLLAWSVSIEKSVANVTGAP